MKIEVTVTIEEEKKIIMAMMTTMMMIEMIMIEMMMRKRLTIRIRTMRTGWRAVG